MLVKGSAPKWLRDVSDDQRQVLRESARKLAALQAPRNKQELWHLVRVRFGKSLAWRPAVEGHQTPLDWVWDAFTQAYERMFAMASKTSGKTAGFAIVHQLNSEHKPGLKSAHTGAIDVQAHRCSDEISGHLDREKLVGKTVDRILDPIAIEGNPLKSMFRWKNGSVLEIMAGTLAQASGVHPSIAGVDEFEQFKPEVWEHVAKGLHETPTARAQMLVGSTRFRRGGPVQNLLDDKRQAFKVYRWNVYDVMSRCAMDCHNVPPGFEKGDGTKTCILWSREEVQADGTVQEVPMCHGAAHHGTGHLTPAEVTTAFLLSDMLSWGVIMELANPRGSGTFFPEFDDVVGGKHIREEYEYVPGREVLLGFDDGYHWPLCLGAWQVRPDGLLYQFDEVYEVSWKTPQLCEELKSRPWLKDVRWGFPDPSAHQAIDTLNDFFRQADVLGRPAMVGNVNNGRVEGWKIVRKRLWGPRGESGIGWHPRCSNTTRDLGGLVRREGTEDCEKKNDHGADQVRYLVVSFEERWGQMDEEARRPRGSADGQQAQSFETQIRQRWDQLRGYGRTEDELKKIETQFATDRQGLMVALGAMVSEFTIAGRLSRAGLRTPDAR